jgi:hypothetical protein
LLDARWIPVRAKKPRQAKSWSAASDSIRSGTAQEAPAHSGMSIDTVIAAIMFAIIDDRESKEKRCVARSIDRLP